MDRLGFPEMCEQHLRDPRDQARITHTQRELIRTELLRLAQGWMAHADVKLLHQDPALGLAVSSRRGDGPLREARRARQPEGLCSQPTLSRLLAALRLEENRAGLSAMLLESAERRMGPLGLLEVLTLDLDSVAGSWERERRIVLVVPNRGEQQDLLPEHFFLLTNVPAEEMGAEALLEHYRKRGEAEKDFGDWQTALPVRPCSTPRTKTHYRGRVLQSEFAEPDSFAANEARLLLSLLAANLMHAGAELLGRERKRRMSRERFRQLILKATGRVLLSGRRVTLVIGALHAELWSRLLREMDRLYPSRGSPGSGALPMPA